MVKAIRVHRAGGPEALVMEDVALAPPAPARSDRAPRHRRELHRHLSPRRRLSAPTPFIPGHEGAGEVIAVGEGVEEFRGRRPRRLCRLARRLREARNIEAGVGDRAAEIRSYETGAAMMLKGSPRNICCADLRVKKGDRILVHAGAGGVGQFSPMGRARRQGDRHRRQRGEGAIAEKPARNM